MAKNTWLKLWRSTAKNSLIRNAKASQLFLWMLLEAAWTKKRDGGVDLQPGELLTSMPLIQIELNMSNKQVRDAVKLLESFRIVAHDSRFEGRGLGRGKKTIYRFINWSKYQSQAEEGRELVGLEGGGPSIEVAGVEENSHTGQEDSSPKNLKKERTIYSADFESFWQAYPVRKGKDGAYKVWEKKKPELQAVLKTIATLKAQDSKWRDGFIQHPQTWLNAGGWMDEVFKPLPSIRKTAV